ERRWLQRVVSPLAPEITAGHTVQLFVHLWKQLAVRVGALGRHHVLSTAGLPAVNASNPVREGSPARAGPRSMARGSCRPLSTFRACQRMRSALPPGRSSTSPRAPVRDAPAGTAVTPAPG